MPDTSSDTVACRRLVGRTAVITGAGSGIGRAAARRLAAEGAKVVVADSDEQAGRAAAAEVGGLFVAVDVTDPYLVEALFDTAYETYGGVDIAFHALATERGPADGPDAWRDVQRVDLTSVSLCCHAALPYMRRHGRGSIINTAGFTVGASGAVAHAAARAGVLAMSRELGVQFAREGIRVNALSSGPVDTPLLGELLAADPERAAASLAQVPLGRFARPEEIAAAVAFLASDDSSFVTASEFLVDGGISGANLISL